MPCVTLIALACSHFTVIRYFLTDLWSTYSHHNAVMLHLYDGFALTIEELKSSCDLVSVTKMTYLSFSLCTRLKAISVNN